MCERESVFRTSKIPFKQKTIEDIFFNPNILNFSCSVFSQSKKTVTQMFLGAIAFQSV